MTLFLGYVGRYLDRRKDLADVDYAPEVIIHVPVEVAVIQVQGQARKRRTADADLESLVPLSGNVNVLAAISGLRAGVAAQWIISASGIQNIDGLNRIAETIVEVFDLEHGFARKCVRVANINGWCCAQASGRDSEFLCPSRRSSFP